MFKKFSGLAFIILVFAISSTSIAGTCTDNSIPPGRFYADSVSKIMAENDLITEFKVVKNSTESGWLSFNSNTDAGKNSLSILLTAGAAAKKISFYVVAGQCNGNKLSVDRFMIEF